MALGVPLSARGIVAVCDMEDGSRYVLVAMVRVGVGWQRGINILCVVVYNLYAGF